MFANRRCKHLHGPKVIGMDGKHLCAASNVTGVSNGGVVLSLYPTQLLLRQGLAGGRTSSRELHRPFHIVARAHYK